MAKPLDFIDGARTDFDESFNWYVARSAGAAIGFAAAVDEAIEKIEANPDRFPATLAGCRYCPVVRYPFRVVFLEQEHRLVVVAIAHAKKRPQYWRGRV